MSLIHIGTVVSAHGIKGEVKIRSFVEDLSLFEAGDLLDAAGKKLFSLKITGKAKDAIIAKVSGVIDRNSSELLKGIELFTTATALPPAEDDEFYYSQLVGLEVRSEDGKVIGKITDIANYGAGDVIEITRISGETEMLPFCEPWVGEINLEQGFVIINPPEYLEAENNL